MDPGAGADRMRHLRLPLTKDHPISVSSPSVRRIHP